MLPRAFMFIIPVLFLSSSVSAIAQSTGNVIRLNPALTHQTITGWESTSQAGAQVGAAVPNKDVFPLYRDALFDLAADDLGLNRIRVEVRSYSENPVDYFTAYLNGQIDMAAFRPYWYEIINDNNDPFVINPNGFNFAELDHTIETVVLPLKQRVEANGEKLYLNFNLVDFAGSQGSSNLQIQNFPEEYGEFVLATYQHVKSKYGWVPDSWEAILEPDVAGYSGTQIGNALAAAARRLKANGFTPAFVGPSNTNMTNAVSYFDQMIQVPGVLAHLTELSYHRYNGVSDASLQAIAQRGMQYGINTAMLEHIGSGYEDLHKDLKVGRNSSWQQLGLAFTGTNDSGANYYLIDDRDRNNPVVIIASRTKFLRQYFKYIRSGAVRIEATSTNSNFDPLAFINQNGKYVVVIKANAGGDFSVQDLPSGSYGIKYTTASQYNVDLPEVAIGTGQAVKTNIPASGVITVYAKTSIPNSVGSSSTSPPAGFFLQQNHPNPFNAVTALEYHLPKTGRVKLAIIDLMGQEIALLVDSLQEAGVYQARWDASRVNSGIYLYRLQVEGATQTRKLLLLK